MKSYPPPHIAGLETENQALRDLLRFRTGQRDAAIERLAALGQADLVELLGLDAPAAAEAAEPPHRRTH